MLVLVYVYVCGIVYCDVKLLNILVDDSFNVWFIDFGFVIGEDIEFI